MKGTTTHKITATDQGGGLCARLSTSTEAANARRTAIAKALDERKDTYSYEYRVHTADEFSNGLCSVWVRFGGGDGTLKYNAAQGSGKVSTETPGTTSLTEVALDIVPPGWQALSGLYLRGYFRFAGGKVRMKPSDPRASTPDVENYVSDMSIGGMIDIVPGWLYGLGLHVYLHYNYLGGGWSTGSMLDLTFKIRKYAVKVGIGIDDREIAYTTGPPINADSTTYMLETAAQREEPA